VCWGGISLLSPEDHELPEHCRLLRPLNQDLQEGRDKGPLGKCTTTQGFPDISLVNATLGDIRRLLLPTGLTMT